MTRTDKMLIAGTIVIVGIAGAIYSVREDVAAQYELRFEPARYWRAELGRRQFGFKMGVIQLEECHADLLAARMKEPARVARMKLLGFDESSALKDARDESESQALVCKVLADMLDLERRGLAEAERRHDAVRRPAPRQDAPAVQRPLSPAPTSETFGARL